MNDHAHAFARTHEDGPRLLADIGGTNARFALERGPGRIEAVATLACAEYATLADAVRAYLARHPGDAVRHAVLAIATPIDGDAVRMTNHHWQFSIAAMRDALGLATLLVVNDFAALAMSVPGLAPHELVQVGGEAVDPGEAAGVIGVLGAGTGLGMAGLVPAQGRWTVLGSEGGHVAFSPIDAREQAILSYCWTRWPHVSAERLVSGPGLSVIHAALCAIAGETAAPLTPAEITERGLARLDARCVETLDTFCAMLGTAAANLAITLCARGGVYIGGGVVPRLGEMFARSSFRALFEHKGRYSDYIARIPCYVIHARMPALAGAAALLDQHLADNIGGCAMHAPMPALETRHALA
jgi:glucokinase